VQKSHDPMGHIPDNNYINAKSLRKKAKTTSTPKYRDNYDQIFSKPNNNKEEKWPKK